MKGWGKGGERELLRNAKDTRPLHRKNSLSASIFKGGQFRGPSTAHAGSLRSPTCFAQDDRVGEMDYAAWWGVMATGGSWVRVQG